MLLSLLRKVSAARGLERPLGLGRRLEQVELVDQGDREGHEQHDGHRGERGHRGALRAHRLHERPQARWRARAGGPGHAGAELHQELQLGRLRDGGGGGEGREHERDGGLRGDAQREGLEEATIFC